MTTSIKKLRGSQWDQPMQVVAQNHLISYPTPSNLNGNYNWGVQAGLCLVLQIRTGIFLAMHYTAHVDQAFHSVQHQMRDVPNGWQLRYLHANGASLFFIVVYMHLFRGLYYTSYAQPREFVWLVGVVILLIMILTAFIGYVLPWGQMSLWGRTVITSLASALPVVGTSIVGWQWGGFCVDNPTQNRFYSFHYLFPFLLAALSLVHLAALHQYGSTNPLGINAQVDLVDFYRAPMRYCLPLIYNLIQYSCIYMPTSLMYRVHLDDRSVYCKAFFRCVKCKFQALSGGKSSVSPGGRDEKQKRATFGMVRITNLIYCPRGLVESHTPLLLMGMVCHGDGTDRANLLYTVDTTTFTQKVQGQQGPKPNNGGFNGTLAWPKPKQGLGQRAFVVGRTGKSSLLRHATYPRLGYVACRRGISGHYYTTEGKQANICSHDKSSLIRSPKGGGADALKRLRALAETHKKSAFTGLIYVIAHPDTLILAYELIKSKTGNMTPGTSKETLYGLDMNFIHKTARKLLSGTYNFSPARRVEIPKPGKSEKRPLKIANPREKVVQKAMELTLNRVYDCVFLETSHGFRPNKSCHTALKSIDVKAKGVAWFIEADITKCFDSIPHRLLLDVLSKRIQCQKTLALIQSGLEAGYVQMGGIRTRNLLGTPQGSVLSPLLCNIFMHELDLYMEQLCSNFRQGANRRMFPRYRKLQKQFSKAKTIKEKLEFRKLYRKLPSKDPMDPNFRRAHYVRYADDFLISVIGSRKDAVNIMQLVGKFLENSLGLTLSRSKTKITHARKDAAYFLGTEISWNASPDKKVVMRVRYGTQSRKKVRVQARVGLKAPTKKLVRKLVERKFFKWGPSGHFVKPTGLTRMINFDHADIIKYYNAVGRGIQNYYSFVDNTSRVQTLIHYQRYSCSLTLAKKYKLVTSRKAFKKFGKYLKCPETGVAFYQPPHFKRRRQFSNSSQTQETLEKSWANKLTRSNLGKVCIICGNTQVQMHHLRTIKQLKRKHQYLDWFTMQMAAINRKQVPLCKDHHAAVHRNSLSPWEKELFAAGCKKLVKGNQNL